MRKLGVTQVVGLGAAFLLTGTVWGQDYPNRPIRILTGQAGGSPDLALRLMGPNLQGPLGQPIVVDNRPGSIPAETVAKAPPDGYAFLVDGGSFWIGPLLQPANYDVVKDFSPVASTFGAPNILVVNAAVPVNSVKDLIALAKSKPGALNYASSAAGSSSHLAAELFKVMAGVDIVRIVYKGPVLATSALLQGDEVQLQFGPPSSSIPNIKAGKLKGLAVTSAQPSALAPGIPPMTTVGLPGYESGTYYGLFAPAKTPTAVITRLNQEFVRELRKPDTKEKLVNIGLESTGGSTPDELGTLVHNEMAKWGKLIKDQGIKAE